LTQAAEALAKPAGRMVSTRNGLKKRGKSAGEGLKTLPSKRSRTNHTKDQIAVEQAVSAWRALSPEDKKMFETMIGQDKQDCNDEKSEIAKKDDEIALLKQQLEKKDSIAKGLVRDYHFMRNFGGDSYFDSRWDTLEGTGWQEDPEICCKALDQGLGVLKLSSVKNMQNPEFVARLISSVRRSDALKNLWEFIGDDLKRNELVSFSAWKRKTIPISKVTMEFNEFRARLLEDVKANRFTWRNLPLKLRREITFALSAVSHQEPSSGPSIDILRAVTDKEKLWREGFCKNCSNNHGFSDLWDLLPLALRQDRDLVLTTLTQEPKMVKHLDDSLSLDYEYVQTLIKANSLVLAYFNRSTYEHFPSILDMDLIAKIMSKVDGCLCLLREKLPLSQWEDRNFLLGWLSLEGVLHDKIPESLRDDEEVILTAVKSKSFTSRCFKNASSRLRSDMDFMLKVVEFHDLYGARESISESIKTDKRFLLARVAAHKASMWDYRYWSGTESCERWIRNALRDFKGYFVGMLCGSREGSGSPLVVLNSQHDIQRYIASYLEFSSADNMQLLFRASKNICKSELLFHPYDNFGKKKNRK
jgi:hypothetical protein